MKTISALIDFSDTSKVAMDYACWLAKRNDSVVNLIHIVADNDYNKEELENKLKDFTGIDAREVKYNISIGTGDYLQQIPRLIQLSDSDFVVIGTHGVKGIFQTLFGANVIKLVQSISVSALVVQDNTPPPSDKLKNILFPLGPHENFQMKIDQAADWALSLGAKVDVFCLLKEDGNLHDNIHHNLELTKSYFDKEGVDYQTIMRESQVYSIGYAREILEFAKEDGAGLLAIMAQISEENRYFGNVDKTNMVLNADGIPVLCVNG